MSDRLRKAAQTALGVMVMVRRDVKLPPSLKALDASIAKLEAALAEEPRREHITDGNPCWCNPDTHYTDPDTGASVIVHREPQ